MRFLFRLARTAVGRRLIGWVFEHGSFAIPVRRLYETDTLMAFYHPAPSYPLHILLVPKKAIRSLTDLTPADVLFLADLFDAVRRLVAELKLEEAGYRLIVNGGPYQDVPQLHFHLVSEKKKRPGFS
jgi:histidine triad (HIT) family protein